MNQRKQHLIAAILATATLAVPAQSQETPPVDAAPPISGPRMLKGNDQLLAPPNTAGLPQGKAGGFRFEEAPVADVVSLVLRELAKVDYVIHPPINGTVTLSTQGEISVDHAVLLLEAALQANGLQMARDPRGVYHVGRPESLKSIVPAVRQSGSGPLPPGYGAVVISLKYMSAAEMASILRPLSGGESIVRVDPLRNLLVMVGTRTQAEGWLDIVNTFDVDIFKGMSVGVFPLKHISAKEVEAAMRLLGGVATGVTAPAAPATNTGGQPGGSAGAPAAPPAAAAAGAALANPFTSGAMRLMPIERLNSILVITPRAALLDEARRWIEKIDQPGGRSNEAQLFVYPVQNGNAQHLAGVLNGLFGSGSGNAAPQQAQQPAQQPARTVAPGLQAGMSGTAGFGAAAANASPQGASLTTMTLASGLRIMADGLNNAILVFGTPAEFERIQATLKRLDLPPTQVLIEASIVEVTLNDDLQYGLQWAFNDPARDGYTGRGIFSRAAAGAFAGTPAGFSYTLTNSAGQVRAVLNALATKSLVKVISSPSLMVLDNHTASIVVGDQQPVRTGETITSGGVISNNIQYKDTGVALSVTPSVNSGNMVTMQINQAVTDVGTIDDATNQRSFLQRQFNSKVAVRSGETIVLGGLIRDNGTKGKSGVPLLQDIPLLGPLFATNSSTGRRTELLVVITPRVVRTDNEVLDVSQELRERMRGLKRITAE